MDPTATSARPYFSLPLDPQLLKRGLVWFRSFIQEQHKKSPTNVSVNFSFLQGEEFTPLVPSKELPQGKARAQIHYAHQHSTATVHVHPPTLY